MSITHFSFELSVPAPPFLKKIRTCSVYAPPFLKKIRTCSVYAPTNLKFTRRSVRTRTLFWKSNPYLFRLRTILGVRVRRRRRIPSTYSGVCSKPIRVLTRTKSSCTDDRLPLGYDIPDFEFI